jgi:carboxylate-amine ligase
MERTGVVKSMKDFYWDIRPKPEYGTIELRVCDTPLTVDRAAALACYLQALCRSLLAGSEPAPAESDYLVYNYNRFQACRFGLDGTIVHPRTYEALPLREDILTTLRKIGDHAEACGATAAVDHLYETIKGGSDASLLRREFEQSGSAEGMVNAAIRAFRRGGSGPAR